MSSISLPYEKQIRHFYLSNDVASETTISTFTAGATIGEMQIFNEDGSADTDGDFYIAKKNTKNGLSVSDTVTPADITYLGGAAPQSKVGKVQTFTLGTTPTAGTRYFLSLKVNYGNSEENFIMFNGNAAVAASGDTSATVLGRLAKTLADNLAKSVNTSTNISGTDVVAGVGATGTVQLSAGASGTVDTLTVDGVSLIDTAITFATDLDTTAGLLADAINAKVTVPNYTATVSTDTVTITSVIPGVIATTVASTSTTLTTVDVDMGTASAGTSIQTADVNKYFTVAANATSISIIEKDWILDGYRPGLKSYDQLLWNGVLSANTDAETANVTASGSAPVFAKGQGYQIIELERYLVGHRAETGELLDSTLGFGRPYDASTAVSYYTLDLKYFDRSRDDEKRSEKMITIASDSNTAINIIGNAIEARNAAFVWTDF